MTAGDYVVRRTERIQAVERKMRRAQVLNHRQQALISHALRHRGHRYTIESHRMSHKLCTRPPGPTCSI